MEIKSMKKMIEETLEKQTDINAHIALNRQQIQAIINGHEGISILNNQISKLVRDSNVLTGNIDMLNILIKIEEEERASLREEVDKAVSKTKSKKKKK